MAGDARSGLVRLLKVALPLTALGLVAAVFLSPRPEPVDGLGFSGVTYDAAQGLRLERPRFTGRTPDGRPFVVSADWALPDGPDPETVGLGPMRGEVVVDGSRTLTLTAGGGLMKVKAETLTLEGPVRVETSDGYAMDAASADVDVGAQTLSAAGPVAGRGPAGTIAAATMRAARREESHYIWFEGGVRVRIDPARVE